MFQLTLEEGRYVEILRSQSATLERRGRFRKYAPFVFTEHGIAMLSSIPAGGLTVPKTSNPSDASVSHWVRNRPPKRFTNPLQTNQR
jgi:hypothetical protein